MLHVRCAALGIVVLATACSTASPSTVTDAGSPTDAKSEGDAPAPPNEWSCLGKVTLSPPEAATGNVTFTALDNFGKPVANLDVRGCPDREDATCANATTSKKTDANGEALLTVPLGAKGFDGYFEATEATDTTNLHFVPNPITKATASHSRTEWRAAPLKLLTDTVGVALDPAKGNILFEAHNCNSPSITGTPFTTSSLADGVTLTIEPSPAGVSLGYVVSAPSPHVSLQATATDGAAGTGGFLNVPPGLYTITGKREKTGERVGTQRVHVRAGAFSLVILAPTP